MGSLSKGTRAHHIVTILELRASTQYSLLVVLLVHHVSHVGIVLVAATIHHLLLEGRLVFPCDLELSDSGLFDQNVTSKFLNDGLLRRVFVQLLVFIVVVDVVTYSEELLLVVGACDKDTSNSNDVVLLKNSEVRSSALKEFELGNLLVS